MDKSNFLGKWSLDRIALDQTTRSKVFFINFGTRPKKCFGTRSKVLIMVFLAFKTFDLVKKVASSYLVLDWKS